MKVAISEARKAIGKDEVPVGAVIVYEGRIIARAHNQIVLLHDPTAHAEMIAITQAAGYLKNERLVNTSVYVTIEPCPMCAGAMVLSRVKRLFYGASDPKSGSCGSLMNIVQDRRLNHSITVKKGLMEEECRLLMQEFFRRKRCSNN
ncbi:MAG: nucleoside deaminase [Candidatus Omnitrophica bacterium]|nr:nucleoside deaminase [Candidatus Omnitrophota bacterium]